ncbi:rhomboid family intramembrane serine protease [Mucilaginibacter sp. Bleaf8]|uniref:rhomboid family intramembrane serine protease n=1 Tax=Mucilaginibacter sp. Bleaf8 TaxID=2834430 RepID=UPI001BCD7A00|nr:rhomboid family intramembrane serine protease [Mucilaginibacter sp. Bleaf8]MBS7566636.1 rhomboid family intramembrane serine protease [Mucilaginibacter sp. Bleaf8]
MSTLWQELRYKMLQSGSKLNLLIGINVLVFLAINIPAVILHMMGNDAISIFANEYLSMPAYLPQLATHFWTPITYMFMHDGIFHILFNMLWLFWMGQLFEEYLGKTRIVSLYFLGGLAGAALFILAFNVLPAFSKEALYNATVVGASASVMAVVIATATLLPNYTIYLMFLGPVKLKWLALFYVTIDFLGILGPNAGGEIAHLGGALLGFIYIKQLKSGHDWNRPMDRILNQRPKVTVASKNRSVPSNAGRPREEEIDRILDKISQSGYDSLNKQEKETLFRASNHNEG